MNAKQLKQHVDGAHNRMLSAINHIRAQIGENGADSEHEERYILNACKAIEALADVIES